ncbi:MAG: BlaI/MecI/CopY family transcriptional regulator [Pseudomonadota bacterium]
MSQKITQAEFEIMDALWAEAPLAAADIAGRLKAQTDWSVKTVKTLLTRLVEKGAVAHEEDGRRYLYRPLLSRAAYARTETSSLAQKLFGGRAAPLVAHLAEADGLSADDLNALERLVEELKRDSD